MSKRYLLVKAEGEGPKTCAFFSSEAGCRNGANCKFLHGNQSTAGSAAASRATKPADVVTTSKEPSQPPPGPSVAEGGTTEAEDERLAKKKARKEARKAKERSKVAAEHRLNITQTADGSVHCPTGAAPVLQSPNGDRTVQTLAEAAPSSVVIMSDGATPDGAGSAATKVLSLAKAEILDQKKKRRKTNKDAMVAKASSSIPTTAVPNGASAVALGVGTNEHATASTTWVVPQPKKTKKEKKKCSFFNKKKGCRSGALCPFLHEGVEMGGSRVASNVKPPLPEESPVEVKASRDAVTSTNGTPMAKPLLPTPGKPFVAVDHPAATPTPRVSLPTSGALPSTPTAHDSTPTAHDSGVGSDRLTRKRGRSKTANAVQHLASPSASSGLLDGLPVSPFVTAAASAKEQGHGPLGGVGLVDKAEAAPEGIPHVRADPWQVKRYCASSESFCFKPSNPRKI